MDLWSTYKENLRTAKGSEIWNKKDPGNDPRSQNCCSQSRWLKIMIKLPFLIFVFVILNIFHGSIVLKVYLMTLFIWYINRSATVNNVSNVNNKFAWFICVCLVCRNWISNLRNAFEAMQCNAMQCNAIGCNATATMWCDGNAWVELRDESS